MPLKFVTARRCKEDDCRAYQPDRSPEYKYKAPTTCYSCHSWHDEFPVTLKRVSVRVGFRWNANHKGSFP